MVGGFVGLVLFLSMDQCGLADSCVIFGAGRCAAPQGTEHLIPTLLWDSCSPAQDLVVHRARLQVLGEPEIVLLHIVPVVSASLAAGAVLAHICFQNTGRAKTGDRSDGAVS